MGNPTQIALWKKKIAKQNKKKPAWDCRAALGGAETGKTTFLSMEHVSRKTTLKKNVTDAAQTY